MKNYRYIMVSIPLFLMSAHAYTLTINQPTNGELKCSNKNEFTIGENGKKVITEIPCTTNLEKITIFSFPDDGYVFDEWRGNCSHSFSKEYCFLNMDGDKIVSIGLKKAPMYNLSITQPTHGKIYCNGGTCKSQYPKGTEVYLSTYVDSGYEFIKWDGGSWGESSEHPLKVIISENKNYSAIIKKIVTEEPPSQDNSGGFDFGGSTSGCEGGSGDFQQQIEYWNNDPEKVVTVGTIPKDLKDVYISLKSDEDVDIRLYDVNGEKIVHWPNGILSGDGKDSTSYNGVTVEYSGYNGDGTGLGHEYIKISGTTQNDFVMKAFGYKAGYAKVDYSWAGKANCSDNSTPSASGSGDFEQQIIQKDIVKVGDIPPKVNNLYITLKSDEDIDIQLYDKDDGTAIIKWADYKEDSGILYGDAKQTTNYKGMQIEWSGYNGDGTGLGHEYIKITGETTRNLTMKAYGYKAGYAKVHYEWGGDNNSGSDEKTSQFTRNDIYKTVTDSINGLTWQDNSEAKTVRKKWSVMYDTCVATGASSACQNVNGSTADYYCKSLNMGGYSDWRLPTIDELKTIVDDTKTSAPYIPNAFKNVSTDYGYWSSTADSGSIYHAMMISFMSSNGMPNSFTKGTENYVRCVRD